MDRLAQAEALVGSAEAAIDDVHAAYEQSLSAKHVAADLQIAIKNVVENLRSALDYAARAIHQSFGGATGKVYFPICRPDAQAADFPSRANKDIPGVRNHPDWVRFLMAMQAFHDPANAWLPKLASLAAENKHENLTPQRRVEESRTTVETAGAGMVSWGPGVTFGPGVSIGGVPVDPRTQLPVPHPSQTVRRETWVDFTFESTGDSVLPLLRSAAAGTRSIVRAVREKLET